MSIRKFAEASVISATMATDHGVGSFMARTAHRAVFDYEVREGYLYVRSRAISSRTNDNFDTFPAKEIKTAYKTFEGKPVFVNHHNADHRRARGVILQAALHEDILEDGQEDTWVEVLMEVDATNFPMLAKAILAGEIDKTSMGVDLEFSTCSFCGNRASNPAQYCSHIPNKKGQRIRRVASDGSHEDVLVHEFCEKLSFFENSLLVEDPADPTAFFLGVDDSGVDGDYQGKVSHMASKKKRSKSQRQRRSARKKNLSRTASLSAEAKRMGKTHQCSRYGTPGLCNKGDGASKRSKCSYCGASIHVFEGMFGVFEWKRTGLYPQEDAIAFYSNRSAADRRAEKEGDMAVSMFILDSSLDMSKIAYGETKAPPQVDTLRDDNCPICADTDSFDGAECKICGYAKPPEEFMDPDLTKAQEVDLRQSGEDGLDGEVSIEGDEDAEGEEDRDLSLNGETFSLEKSEEEDDDELEPGEDDTFSLQDDEGDNEDQFSVVDEVDEIEDDGDEEDQFSVVDKEDSDESEDPDAVNTDEAPEESMNDEDEDDPRKKPKKKPKKTSAARHEEGRNVLMSNQGKKNSNPRRELLRTIAAQQRTIDQQGSTNQAQSLALKAQAVKLDHQGQAISRIAELAGIDLSSIAQAENVKLSALIKSADAKNPAQPVSEPGATSPVETSGESLSPGSNGSGVSENHGSGTVTDVTSIGGIIDGTGADTTVSPTDVGGIIDDGLDLTNDSTTSPVAGTTDGAGDTTTDGDVTAIDEVRGEVLFPIESKLVDPQARVFASLALARKRISAGIEAGDDLSVGQKIAVSDMTNEAIAAESATLDAVASNASPTQPAPRSLVPRSASRGIPSISTTNVSSTPIQGSSNPAMADAFLLD